MSFLMNHRIATKVCRNMTHHPRTDREKLAVHIVSRRFYLRLVKPRVTMDDVILFAIRKRQQEAIA